MQQIAIVGPGAVGGTVAAWLAQSPDLSVTVCARAPFDGLSVETPDGEITATPNVLTEPSTATPQDWVLVCTKAYDAAGALTWLGGLVGPETKVAVLQNGVEHVERFAPHLPGVGIVPAVVDIPAERAAPGRIRQRRMGTILVPAGADSDAFVDLFAHTPIEVSTTDDFKTAAWRKLALNCAGAVNALTLKPSGVAHREAIADIMQALVAECVLVGRAEGAVLPDDLGRAVVDGYRSGPADGVNSLHADRAAGRPMELDARNGVIVRFGARHGIATPMNAMIVALIEAAAAPGDGRP
ncbi:2-dehydropantoate 2-reductase [Caulobacter sp. NIBR2454]|uniref:2-dehydropantoate 2-reductase n=1 Tax=Caulobacter sp. NIBR2454 TaxID=3015996 RepID=UPI0022B7413C|nr:2-dehydropantoate 2-reductase [Caulobacter sp. NIBR2454]